MPAVDDPSRQPYDCGVVKLCFGLGLKIFLPPNLPTFPAGVWGRNISG
jgi:hypothetical protein